MTGRVQRLVFIDQYAHVGGGQVVLLDVLRAARAAGHACSVLAPRGGALEDLIRTTVGADLPMHDLPALELTQGRKGLRDLLKLAASPRALQRLRGVLDAADLVYLNGPHWFYAWSRLNRASTPSVFHLHLDHSYPEKLLIGRIAAAGPHNTVLLNSSYVKARLLAALPALAARPNVCMVHNALGAAYARLPFAWRGRPNSLSIAVIGRLIPEKGHHLVVELARSFPGHSFYVLGGEERGAHAYAADLRRAAPSNVHFLGHVLDVPAAIAEHGISLSIVPSEWQEPFGLTAIESMAMSCLTLVRRRGELTNIAAKTDALLFDSAQDLAFRLQELGGLADAERRALAERQHARALLHFHPARFAQQIGQLLQHKLSGSAAGHAPLAIQEGPRA